MDDVAPAGRVLPDACDQLLLVEFVGVQRKRRAELTGRLQPRRETVDRDELPASEEPRLEQMAKAERPDAVDDDALSEIETPDLSSCLDPMCHRHHLCKHRELVRQLGGDAEDRCSREEVHQLRPAAEERRHARDVERVAVVLHALAEVVRLTREAVPAGTAGDVCAWDDPVTRAQRCAVGSAHLAAGRLDDPDVLVPADQRILDVSLVRCSRVLDCLAAERVLVRPADPGQSDPHEDGA